MEQMCFSGVVDVFVGKSRIVLLQCVLLQFVHEEGVDLRDEGRVVLANVVANDLKPNGQSLFIQAAGNRHPG